MYELLFHPAIWLPAIPLIVGVAVFIYGNARVQSRIRTAGLGIVALTLAWCVAAYAIDTPVEQCVKRTNAIVSAVENGKWDAFRTLIDKNTVVEIYRTSFRGPDVIGRVIEGNAGAYGLKSINVLNTDVTTGTGAYDVTINTFLEGNQSTTARFTFQYEQRSDGILLSHIVPLSVGNMSVDDFINFVKRGAGR